MQEPSKTSLRSFAIHAHFYQPPREDPFSGIIPDEVGASPYKNWNERIHAECYKPNAELENFARISFNVGPTLCAWMANHDPAICKKIVAQDQGNVRLHGVGNAIAQAYNHTILPLANPEDKITQVAWGIADFEHRFGRKPQGMWLPETAADIETLEVLVDQGIEFTILAPWQADSQNLDPTEAYQAPLPGGRSITVFFYHSGLSSRVSFDPGATSNADNFIRNHLISQFQSEKVARGEPQLLLIASDGELYGHHQIFRDRFLAHLVNGASSQVSLNRTYPALWLRENPPRRSIGIKNKTSWSCHHGVLRWMGQCGCTSGDGVWKAYFRRAFDKLAVSLDRVYETALSEYQIDPWVLRHRYIHVILGETTLEDLLGEVTGRRFSGDDVARMRLLLESQRERQRMFTSCGWFFDDFSRIEPRNNVAYAAQAVRLVRKATGEDLAPRALADLKHVYSHRTGLRGDMVFQHQLLRAEQFDVQASIPA